ncbi:MFS transporter [Novosphingobium sp.]|uniref:MFS transporter n=1 Tax=Novosphingobium sp. TaxID=1874826 RepID=UPI003340E43F
MLYAWATFGAHVSYAPLLALLLPRRIIAVAPDRAAAITSVVVLVGAITASLAHIMAGRFSDGWRRRHGNRRVPIAVGLGLTMAALTGLGLAQQVPALVVGLVAFQIALNLMFAPLGALLVDHFADHAKGRVAALANLAIPLAGLGTGVAALAFPRDSAVPFVAVAGLVGLSVLPLIVVWPFAAAAMPASPSQPALSAPSRPQISGPSIVADLARIGLARLLMQCGASFVVTYFYLFIVRHPDRAGVLPGHSVDVLFGRLVLVTTLAVLVVTVLAGRWSDHHRRRRAPMMASALVAGLALCALQAGSGWLMLAGYGLFQVGLIAYLALDAALVAQALHNHPRPGEMLGYMNLANTLPSIVVPGLVLAVAGATAESLWAPGFAGAAACCVLAALLISRIRTVV